MTVMDRIQRSYPLIALTLVAAVIYLGWPWDVLWLLLAGWVVLGLRERSAPELLAGLLAAAAYWYGGWPGAVVGLLAAALLGWGIRGWQNGPSPSPAENGRG